MCIVSLTLIRLAFQCIARSVHFGGTLCAFEVHANTCMVDELYTFIYRPVDKARISICIFAPKWVH